MAEHGHDKVNRILLPEEDAEVSGSEMDTEKYEEQIDARIPKEKKKYIKSYIRP